MGFMDSFGKLAGEAAKGVVDSAKQQQEYVEKYRDLDDEKLIRRAKSETDFKKRQAMYYVLRERGYGNNN